MTEHACTHHLAKHEGTEGTRGTIAKPRGFEQFPVENATGYSGNLMQPESPVGTIPEQLPEPEINRPEFLTHDKCFLLHDKKHRPGLYWHTFAKAKGDAEPEPVDVWICSPIYAVAITANVHGESFGLLLRFVNPNGLWREWAASMRLLKGSSEELRGELLDMGVRIAPENRSLLTKWMMSRNPKTRIIAALCTGWHDKSFVLPLHTIGDNNIRFQSEHAAHNDFITAGTLDSWKENVATLCIGNPLLMLAVSASFAGPLLKLAKLQQTGGAGIHLMGDSSRGKTTALQAAGSTWGAPEYVRTWRATSNGLEATAAALNDTLLVLDEISECDPREIGTIVYAIANGAGKQRASRNGGTTKSAHWRIIVLSSGERSLSAHIAEGGGRVKAGQQVRLLDIPATNREHGLFDVLHGHPDGRSLADALKQATANHYGYAGPAFVQALLNDKQDFPLQYSRVSKTQGFTGRDGLEGRAAGVFALLGQAGELATEYGITGWVEGQAIAAAEIGFDLWREFRGEGQTETRQITQAISGFILRHGDSRFSSIEDKLTVRERAGYWKENPKGRIFLFNSQALQEAAIGYDIRRILAALKSANWIVEHDAGKRSKKVKVAGSAISLYAIRPDNGGEL